MWALGAFLLLCGCGPSFEEFGEKCRSAAGIKVQNRDLWLEYLRERKQLLSRSKVTVNGKEIDPSDLNPVIVTENFTWTNDWVRRGRPETPTRKPYRNDLYVIQMATGGPVATFRNLHLRVPTFETTLSYTCTDNFPHLYTGSRQHIGAISSMSR
jgi:hypothetical protein